MRNVSPHICELGHLKEWFDRLKDSRWTLVANFQDGIPANGKSVIFRQQDADMEADESWAWLEQLLHQQAPGSRVTVFVPTNATGNVTVSQKYQHGQAATQWGQGMPGVAGYPMLGAAQVAQEVDRARKEWEMEKRIEELENAANAPAIGGIWGIVQQKLQEVDSNTLVEVLGSTLGGIGNLLAPLLMPRAQVQGNPALDHEPEADSPDGPLYQFEADRIIPILVTIRKHFSTDDEFYQFVGALASKFDQAPDMYKSMIK